MTDNGLTTRLSPPDNAQYFEDGVDARTLEIYKRSCGRPFFNASYSRRRDSRARLGSPLCIEKPEPGRFPRIGRMSVRLEACYLSFTVIHRGFKKSFWSTCGHLCRVRRFNQHLSGIKTHTEARQSVTTICSCTINAASMFAFDCFQLLVEPQSPSSIYPRRGYLSLLLLICLLILMNSITSFQRKLLQGLLRLPGVSANCEC